MRFIAVWVVAAALGVSSGARADTLFLKCGEANVTVDLAKNTVNNLPANINTTAIDWNIGPQVYPRSDGNGNDTVTVFNHIDRVAGTFTSRIQVEFPGGMNPGRDNTVSCEAGAAPATKF